MNIINGECEQQSANEEKDDEKNETIIEEDWSHHLWSSSPSIKEEKKKNQTNDQQPRFSYYDTISFPLSSTYITDTHHSQQQQPLITMKLRCMDALTPMDMINLSTGKSDETGNRIWMGSLLFIECMVRPLQCLSQIPLLSLSSPMIEETQQQQAQQQAQQLAQKQLSDLRKRLFGEKQILELGTGTGASLISIGLVGMNNDNNNNNDDILVRPTKMTFTDNDMNVLSLCKINCEINLGKKNNTATNYTVCRLDWGGYRSTQHQEGELLRGSQDTIIATDVIYDLSAINILFETAHYLLKDNTNDHDGTCSREDNNDDDDQESIEGTYSDEKGDNNGGGYFVLSHVPRASIDCKPNQIRQELEKCILEAGRKYNFRPISNSNADFNLLINENDYAIRPNTLMNIYNNSSNINGSNNNNSSNSSSSNDKSSNQKIISSTEYDYEELHSVGASIMIFVQIK
jgi:hypothetical protein